MEAAVAGAYETYREMMKMKIIRVSDKYNKNKVWLIKRYKDGHYYVNQEICGKIIYRSYQRMSKKYIDTVL